LENGEFPAGTHRSGWTGRDHHLKTIASGVYLVRLAAGESSVTAKITLIR